ncbi:DUF7501 family protein [Natronorubrum daqingense]|uniref:Uncharacterized protein n=1 Tax=Natronorubrum daqingense TaxID=588898 RepID=A0A1N6XSM5_9EURY|nr:hypothetical protein [Natronorubrum daqingense]APX95871.1 hypothetical protein BB347_04150 [Natronorubrum daqingense]SIR05293.1 hypothetical protein SAMN05421809_0207 [Natronorubrum daqingense]
MAVNTTADWTNPIHCPFCGTELESPGAGFVDHIEESDDCKQSFDHWRENITGDLAGEWAG